MPEYRLGLLADSAGDKARASLVKLGLFVLIVVGFSGLSFQN
jgi:hypothetical protein